MGVRVDGFMDTPVGVRVLKIDGAFAPRVLKIDTALGREGCGGRLCRQFVENQTTGLRPWENRQTALRAGKPNNRAFGARKCTPFGTFGTTFPPKGELFPLLYDERLKLAQG